VLEQALEAGATDRRPGLDHLVRTHRRIDDHEASSACTRPGLSADPAAAASPL
jgi:hypothetical protein